METNEPRRNGRAWSPRIRVGLAAVAVFWAAQPVRAAGGIKTIARELSRAARNAGFERVAVLPFVPIDQSNAQEGWNIAEKLTTHVVRTGKIQAVERTLLHQILQEQRLAQTGLLDPGTLKRLGKMLSVEAVVTGSFTTRDREVFINARLIDVQTGLIVAAGESNLERAWTSASAPLEFGELQERILARYAPGRPSAPTPAQEEPPPAVEEVREWRDAPTGEDCEGASERADRLESRILDIKARYWANHLRKGKSLADLRVNPGSTISDPDLKTRFYKRMEYWYNREEMPELDARELQLFKTVEAKAYSLHRECGI